MSSKGSFTLSGGNGNGIVVDRLPSMQGEGSHGGNSIDNGNGVVMEWVVYPFGNGNGNGNGKEWV